MAEDAVDDADALAEKKVGFARDEMHKGSLAGTAKIPETHVFLVFGDRNSWAKKLEKVNSPVRTLTKVLEEHPSIPDFQRAFKVTAVEAVAGLDNDGDAYIFPDNLLVKGIGLERLAHFGKTALVDKDFSDFDTTKLTGSHIFVCAHGSRDKRCGYCGPKLINALEAAVTEPNKKKEEPLEIAIHACSHVGGHRYAGNAILYRNGKFVDWLGYLCPQDASYVVELCAQPDIPVELKYWRGRMGFSREAHKVLVKDLEDFLKDGEVDVDEGHQQNAKKSTEKASPRKVAGPARDIAGCVSQLDSMLDNMGKSNGETKQDSAKVVVGGGNKHISESMNVSVGKQTQLESRPDTIVTPNDLEVPKVVFVLGGPGSGKGTQCKLLTESFPFLHISAGEVLREEATIETSEAGALVSSSIKEGKVVTADITVPLLLKKMNQSYFNSFLIDGFPRSMDNWEGWQRLATGRSSLLGVLYFECPEDVLRSRLAIRGRSDDTEDTIRKRLETFRSETLPMVKAFEDQGLLWRINSNQSEAAVFNAVEKCIKQRLNSKKRSRSTAVERVISGRGRHYSTIALGAMGAIVVAGFLANALKRRSDTGPR